MLMIKLIKDTPCKWIMVYWISVKLCKMYLMVTLNEVVSKSWKLRDEVGGCENFKEEGEPERGKEIINWGIW